MEKCPLKQQEEPLDILEKHLQNFAALICPGLSSSPSREASMFPDQYDVPAGFPWIAPKWTEETGSRLRTYLKNSHSFEISVTRAAELLASGKQQRIDEHDDDVYYYISSPEMAPETSSDMALEQDLSNEPDLSSSKNVLDEVKNSAEQQSDKQESTDAYLACSALPMNIGIPGPAVMSENNTVERTDPSPKSGDLPTEHYANAAEHSKKTSGCASIGESSEVKCSVDVSKESPVQTTGLPLLREIENDVLSISNTRQNSKPDVEKDLSKKVHCLSAAPIESGSQMPVMDKDVPLEFDPSTLISSPATLANRTDSIIEGCEKVLPQTSNTVHDETKSQLKHMSKRRGKRRKKKAVKRNTSTVSEKPTPIHNTNVPPCSTQANSEQSASETIHFSHSSLKQDWRSLPRRKKHWIANDTVKRSLRSDIKTSDIESYSKTSDVETTIQEPVVIRRIMSSTPKRKEGFNMRERYGLKTIITDCGRVFIPHGMDVAAGDVKTNETKEPDLVTTNSPLKERLTNTFPLEMDKGNQHTPLTHTQNISVIKSLPVGQITEQDCATHKHSEQPSDSDHIPTSPEKIKNKSVYRAISISKLKTVLKRAKKTGTGGEPETKKPKPNVNTSVNTDAKSSSLLQQNTDLAESLEPTSKTSSKITKENGCNIFHKSSPFVKQVDQQLISTLIGSRVGGKIISSDGKNTKEGLAIGLSVPSDALNLLADLALSVNSEKTLPNLRAKPRQDETHGRAKNNSSPKSELHDLLQISDKLNLTPKSPFPEGLVVTGDLILEISKEHSYSQPTSLWSDLTGACPQVQPTVGCVQSLLSFPRLYSVMLPDHASSSGYEENKGQNGWIHPTSLDSTTSTALNTKEQRSMFLHSRHIIEKESSIQVTRLWKENYDFRYDSKFTNDKHDKCVTRALHGKWDFNIEDTFEQVHLIFHMWIGLFYSKPTSRFFHFDQYCQPLDKKEPVQVIQGSIPASAPLPGGDMSSKEDKHSSLLTVVPVSDALDLSVKVPGAVHGSTKSREENPAPVHSVTTSSEHATESKKLDIQANPNITSNVQPQVILMDYRSTLDVLDESSPADNDSSDLENEVTNITESSYTQLLENNSAYCQLVEQASKIRVDQQKLLKMRKHALSRKDLNTVKTLTKRNLSMMASGTKKVDVFHKVVEFLRPVILSNASEQLPGRKVLIKAQTFKYNAGNEAVVQMCTGDIPKNKECESAFKEENSESNEHKRTLNPQTESSSEETMPVCVTNDETRTKSKSLPDDTENALCESDCDDKESMTDGGNEPMQNDIQETSEAVSDNEEVKRDSKDTPINVRDDASVCINSDDNEQEKVTPMPDVRPDIQMNVPDVNQETTEELLIDNTTTPDVRNDPVVETVVDDDKNESISPNMESEITCDACDVQKSDVNDETPVSDVKDETPVSSVKDETPVDSQNVTDNTENKAQPKEDVQTDTPVDEHIEEKEAKQGFVVSDDIIPIEEHDVNDTNMEGFELKLDVSNDTTDVDDVNINVNEETELDVRDCISVDGQMDMDKTEDTAVHNQILENASGDETNKEEVVDESKTHKSTDLICDSTNNEVNTEEQRIEAEEAMDYVCMDSIDMDISDQDSEDETQVTCFAVNVSGEETTLDQKDTVQLQGGEIKSEKTIQDCQPVIADNFAAGHVSPAHHHIVQLTNGGTCLPQENDNESTNHSDAVHNETPSLGQSRDECNYSPPCSEVLNPEPLDMKDSSHERLSDESIDNQVLVNVTPTQTMNSSRYLKTEVNSSEQTLFPEMDDNLDTTDQSPSALQIDLEVKSNIRSCTPTQDELPLERAVHEDLEDSEFHLYQQGYYYVQQSPTSAELRPDKSGCSYSSDPPDTVYPGYEAQSFFQGNYYSSKYDVTPKQTEKHLTKERPLYVDYEDIPSSRNLISEEETPQMGHFGSFSEQYEEDSSEMPFSWRFRSSSGSEGLKRLRESCRYDEDSHFTNSISAHKEVTHRTRENTERDSDISSWAQQMHYSGSNEPTDGVFSLRHYADLGVSESNDIAVSLGPKRICKSRRKQKRNYRQHKWHEEDSNDTPDFSMKKTFSCIGDETRMLRTSSPYQRKEVKQRFDWRRYFRREEIFDSNDEKKGPFHDPPSSIVTVLDKKGKKVIIERPSTLNRSVGTHGMTLNVDDSLHRLEDQKAKPNITQSLMELEYLTFSEKMIHLLKHGKTSSRVKSQQKRYTHPSEHPMTIQFSRLDEQDSFASFDENWPNLSKFKINVDMSDKKGLKKTTNYGKPLHLQSLFCEQAKNVDCVKILDITKESLKSYQTMMNDICTGKTTLLKNDELKTKWDSEGAAGRKQPGFCGRIKKDMYDNLHENLNSIVRQTCRFKYKFYILVTSADPFFVETKNLLRAEGHIAVEPYEFDLDARGQTPLLIIMRNEDIADHICEVPHLLELKKSTRVLFAGIDQPDDVVNLTHQELFAKGGFVVFDETTINTLNLENMKRVVGIMEELDKKGKWKWFLHYRDSRKLRENARCSTEAMRRKQFMDCCQEAGIVEVLPYHECDVISRDRPDYLRCLVRLQIQNISARFPIFITDTPDDSFEKSGILTMNIYKFQRILSNDT
ncbi:uncharacterized protein LOC134318281 [Trichomycterus rosablanca]|uniref:uncharacterized protein LOC134318281 n=1 Tax=Trichomycterus rosablanca TaxID=2290929 RepID=UPI002F355DFF